MKTNMKAGLLSAMILIAFSSCFLLNPPKSPTERLASFEDHLNTESRASTVDHIHPDATIYSLIDGEYWDSGPLDIGNNPYIFSVTMGAADNGIITGTGTVNYNSADLNVTMTFKESSSGSDDWYILTLTIDGNPIIW